MKRSKLHHYLSYLLIAVFVTALSGCDWRYDDRTELEKIRERGILRVGTLNNQLSYYIGSEGPTGLDYELAKRFADVLGVKLEMQPIFTLSGLFPALKRGDVDLIAAGLTVTPERLAEFRPGPAYYYVSQQVVYKKGHWRPRDIDELNKDDASLVVVSGSSHEQTLNEIKAEHPSLTWEAMKDGDDDLLLKQVALGDIDFTIADSISIALAQRIYPDIALSLELTEDEPVAWFLPKGKDDSVYALMIEFFGDMKQSGQLDTLEEKYFGHVDSFDYVDTRAFLRAIESKLPKWEPLFKQYSRDFDWRLLAAVSYQESHWNPRAISPTGVRGMMMLTLPTAKSVGVKNRLDPEQSIRGGADYLHKILKRVPDSVNEHEKIWFALASYNMGFGHMMDARRLTKTQGGDPDSWTDVKKRIPLLTQRKYYRQTRYGYARGHEALNYVENIRRYYQSIIGFEQAHRTEIKSEFVVETEEGLQTIVAPEAEPATADAGEGKPAPGSTEPSDENMVAEEQKAETDGAQAKDEKAKPETTEPADKTKA